MAAQRAASQLLEGEETGPAYGSVTAEREVEPRQTAARGGDLQRSEVRGLPAQGSPDSSLVAAHRPATDGLGYGSLLQGEEVVPGPFSLEGQHHDDQSVEQWTGLPGEQSGWSPSTPTRHVQMEYTMATARTGAGRQAMVSWVARLTDFLRTTATTAGEVQGRVLDGLGWATSQGHPQQHQQPHLSPAAAAGQQPRRLNGYQRTLDFSPPEELPGTTWMTMTPPPPLATERSTPLFTPEQVQRLRAMEREAPLLHTPGAPSSTSSEEIQAEVQRRLQILMQEQQAETQALRDQVETLRRERDVLEGVQGPRLPHGDRAQQSHVLPHGDRAQQSHVLPPGDRAQQSHVLPPGDRAQQSHVLPPGDRAQQSHVLPHGDRAQQSHVLPHGDRAQQSHVLPHGDRAQQSHVLPPGDRAQQSHVLPHGDRAQQSHALPPGDRAQQSHSLPHGDRARQSYGRSAEAAQALKDEIDALRKRKAFIIEETEGGRGSPTLEPGLVEGSDEGLPKETGENGQPREDERADTSKSTSTTTPTAMDLLGAITAGMRQLQEAQAGMMSSKGSTKDDKEVVKPGVTSLPELKAPTTDTAPVDLQDWLQLIEAPMSDLSDGSEAWWARVQEEAQRCYREWTKATPLERLNLKGPRVKELEEGKFSRVNARAASMVMQALDSSVRSDLVSRRLTSSTAQVIFRLLTLYQPGGEGEKKLVLDHLQNPERQTEPSKAAEALRQWERWHGRATAVGVTIPDATVLVRALSNITQSILEKNPEASFRTSLLRNTLQVDTNPTMENVLALHRHLLAEAEGLAAGAKKGKSNPPTAEVNPRGGQSEAQPRVKGLQATSEEKKQGSPSPTPPSTTKLCKWFAKSDEGCRRGTDCTFSHEWGGVAKTGRCLLCSGVGHQKKDCKAGKRGAGAQATTPKAKSKPETTSTSYQQPTNKALAAEHQEGDQPAAEPSPTTSPTSATDKSSKPEHDDLKKMLAEASSMLKSMMTSTASSSSNTSTASTVPTYESIQRQLDEMKFKAMKVDELGEKKEAVGEAKGIQPMVEDSVEKGVLLDSGSTHVLRPAKGDQELRDSKEVAVVLASEERKLLHQTPEGSILVGKSGDREAVQSIIPFGKVIEVLGCTLKWTKAGFHLHHPRHGRIRTRIRAGCPEITDEGQAAAIIAELEMKKVEELKAKTVELQKQLAAIRMMEVERSDWKAQLAKYAETGNKLHGLMALYQSPIFADIPEEVRQRLVPQMDVTSKNGWDLLKGLPLPRRMRKRLYESDHWLLNLYSGKPKGSDPIQALTGMKNAQGKEVLVINVDVLLSDAWNMNGDVYKVFLWAAMTSKIKGVIGGPPCRTFSAMRHNQVPGGPEPLRSAEHPWGLPTLSAAQRSYAHKDTELIARQIFLYLVAQVAREEDQVGFVLEHPADPNNFLEGEGYPSLWNTHLMKMLEKEEEKWGLRKRTFDQGALGHPCRKPTTVIENLGMADLEGLRDERDTRISPFELASNVVAEWAMGLKRYIATGLKHCGELCAPRNGGISPTLAKLSKEEGWKLHLERDHTPYRRDCAVCVSALGTGRPHRRTKHKSAYVLSVDIGGPMRTLSRDASGRDYRYFLAGAYTFPRFPNLKPEKDPKPSEMASMDYDFKNLDMEPELREEDELSYVPSEDPEHADLVRELEEQLKDLEEQSQPELRAVAAEGEGGLWDDDEIAQKEAEEQKDEEDGGLEMDVIYFMKPLRKKNSKAITRAIQEIYLQLRAENLPVARIHSDRAHELQSEPLREWALDRDILLTRTEGQSPASNGTAERAVRFLKGKARLLLRAADLGVEHWCTAMSTAAHRQREARLRPEGEPPPCPYGARVAIKRKIYGEGGRHDLRLKWTTGRYMGPVWDVTKGEAILQDENNRFTVSTHMRPHLKEPEPVDEEPVVEVEFRDPVYRLRRKTTLDPPHERALHLEGETESWPRKERKPYVEALMDSEIVKGVAARIKRTNLKKNGAYDSSSKYSTYGAYQYGGMVGLHRQRRKNEMR